MLSASVVLWPVGQRASSWLQGKASNYAIKRDLRRNTGFEPSFQGVGPLFWLLDLNMITSAVYGAMYLAFAAILFICIIYCFRLFQRMIKESSRLEPPERSASKHFGEKYERVLLENDFSFVVSLEKKNVARPFLIDVYRNNYLSIAIIIQAYEGHWFEIAPHDAPVHATHDGLSAPWLRISSYWPDYSKPYIELLKKYAYPDEPDESIQMALEVEQLNKFFALVKNGQIQI